MQLCTLRCLGNVRLLSAGPADGHLKPEAATLSGAERAIGLHRGK